MRNRIKTRLRFKLFILIIPVVLMVVITSGILSSMESQVTIIRMSNRHMAYKAEQLRDFAFSEWGMVEKLDLGGQKEYRDAMEESILSYSASLLRSGTEQIDIFDSRGALLHRISLRLPADEPGEEADRTIGQALGVGWFSGTLSGEKRIGIVFLFEPFDWTIAVTELRSQFFSDLGNIIKLHLLILLGAILIISFFIIVYVGRAISPMEHLAETIEKIADTHNLSHRAVIENEDEIGFLAERFNNMISTIEVYQDQAKRTSLAETISRKKAIQSEIETLYMLGRLSDYRDQETGEHQERISALSMLFSQLLGQSPEQQELIKISARLHDIGKIGIPDSILQKEGKLSDEEFEIIKSHTVLGYELLKDMHSPNLKEGATIAYTHHERWDGTGYPRGLSGESIPISGRIVSIVDVFDALVSERPYKRKWTHEEVLKYIVGERGKQFDPMLVDTFVDHLPSFISILQDHF